MMIMMLSITFQYIVLTDTGCNYMLHFITCAACNGHVITWASTGIAE
jgi:hypothetical protein